MKPSSLYSLSHLSLSLNLVTMSGTIAALKECDETESGAARHRKGPQSQRPAIPKAVELRLGIGLWLELVLGQC